MMDRRAAESCTNMFVARVRKHQDGHRDVTALITHLSYEAGWDVAQAVAVVFGVDEARQEQIYRRTQERP